jgi:shikimate kinase
MKQSGPVVWLKAPVEVLSSRIAADGATADRRPNLTLQGGPAEIAKLLSEREPLYRECATLTVDAESSSVEQIVAAIAAAIDVGPSGGRRPW